MYVQKTFNLRVKSSCKEHWKKVFFKRKLSKILFFLTPKRKFSLNLSIVSIYISYNKSGKIYFSTETNIYNK